MCFLQPSSSQVGSSLYYLLAGSRVGLSLDSDHRLHLYMDGHHQGIIDSHVPQPCYALFDMALWTQQVRHVLIGRLLVTAT